MLHRFCLHLALATVVSLSIVSCHTAEAPADSDDCLWDLSARHSVNIHLSTELPLKFYTEVRIEDDEDELMAKSRTANNMAMRYIVRVYLGGTDRLIASTVGYDNVVAMSLPVGKLDIYAWADYVPVGSLADTYYFTDDWSEILVFSKYPYYANDNNKMGFWGRNQLTMPYNLTDVDVSLSPAMGQLRIIATDEPRTDVSKITVSYPGRIPSAINGFSGEVCYSWADVFFASTAMDNGDGKMLLGFDNLFADDEPTMIPIRVEMTTSDGSVVARRLKIDVPVKRGGITEVRAPFYSILEQDEQPPSGSGGIEIDPRLDEEIFIDLN